MGAFSKIAVALIAVGSFIAGLYTAIGFVAFSSMKSEDSLISAAVMAIFTICAVVSFGVYAVIVMLDGAVSQMQSLLSPLPQIAATIKNLQAAPTQPQSPKSAPMPVGFVDSVTAQSLNQPPPPPPTREPMGFQLTGERLSRPVDE